MQSNSFYAVYVIDTGDIAVFHRLPLEKIDNENQKVAYTGEGTSYITIKDKLANYQGKEGEYWVKNSKLLRKSQDQIKKDQLNLQLFQLQNEYQKDLPNNLSLFEELKCTKEYLEWVKAGQPEKDDREKAYLKMHKSNKESEEKFLKKERELLKEIEMLNKK